MQFHLRYHDEDIHIDFGALESTGWYNYECNIAPTNRHSNLHSWEALHMSTYERIQYFLTRYTLISIDDIPFTEWRALHPEYFI